MSLFGQDWQTVTLASRQIGNLGKALPIVHLRHVFPTWNNMHNKNKSNSLN